MKQTAVEYLISKIASKTDNEYWSNQQDITEYVEQAKAMEKEQSKTDYETGQASTKFKFPLPAEQYYQETYERKTTESK